MFEIQADGEALITSITNAINANELFKRDVDYSLLTDDSGNMIGVGEGMEVSEMSQVIAKVTYQSLFRQFTRLSGMSGTAMTDAEEFETIYGLKVVPVPMALPIARREYPDVVFKTREAADHAMLEVDKKEGGRPCLVGTTSVEQSEVIVKKLQEAGIKAELLNASPKNAPRV